MGETAGQPVNMRMRAVALNYLKRRDASSGRLVEYLSQLPRRYPQTRRYHGFTRDQAKPVVEQLQQMGVIDDCRYAKNTLASLRQRTIGAAKILAHLRRRRVSEAVIRSVIMAQDSGGPRDLRRAIADAQRKRSQLLRQAGSDRRKQFRVKSSVAAFLLRRGYRGQEFDDIMRAVVV